MPTTQRPPRDTKPHPLKIDRAGQRFGEWTVLYRVAGGGHPEFWCRCSCGRERQVPYSNLCNGSSTRCFVCGAQKGGLKRRTTTARCWTCKDRFPKEQMVFWRNRWHCETCRAPVWRQRWADTRAICQELLTVVDRPNWRRVLEVLEKTGRLADAATELGISKQRVDQILRAAIDAAA